MFWALKPVSRNRLFKKYIYIYIYIMRVETDFRSYKIKNNKKRL